DAVENLVSAYGYYVEDSRNDAMQGLFSSTPDRPLLSNTQGGKLAVHQVVQPVIHFEADGKSATIRARLLKIDGMAGEFAGATYEGRAINRGGAWKLQSLTLKPSWSSTFNKWSPTVFAK